MNGTSKNSLVIELQGLNGPTAMNHGCPATHLAKVVSPTLEILPDYHAEQGPAVERSWLTNEGNIRMSMQNPALCRSSARVLDGLRIFGCNLRACVVEDNGAQIKVRRL